MATLVGFFPSSRDLRQGDPLSPLLFVVVMEDFSMLMGRASSAVLFFGFSVGGGARDSLEMFHLFFADDSLIFCEVNPAHLDSLRSVLIWFEVVFGLCVTYF